MHEPGAPRTTRLLPTAADTCLAMQRDLTIGERGVLADTPMTSRTMRVGEELVREAEPTGNLHFLIEGLACRFKITRDGRRQITSLIAVNDVCNLDGLMFGRLDYGVRMLTRGSILSLPRERALALADHPGIARSFLWQSFVGNAIIAQWMLCMGRQTARERVAHLLCELSVRVGAAESQGDARFDLPLTQEQLADVLGLTSVHVNRTLNQLRREGFLGSTLRTIVIPDIALLRRVGDFTPGYLHVAGAEAMPVPTPQRPAGTEVALR